MNEPVKLPFTSREIMILPKKEKQQANVRSFQHQDPDKKQQSNTGTLNQKRLEQFVLPLTLLAASLSSYTISILTSNGSQFLLKSGTEYKLGYGGVCMQYIL